MNSLNSWCDLFSQYKISLRWRNTHTVSSLIAKTVTAFQRNRWRKNILLSCWHRLGQSARAPLCKLSKISSLLAQVSHDEAKWNGRRETSAGFRWDSYHACARVSLTISDVFVTCETTQRTGLNLSASGSWVWNFKRTSQSWGWNGLSSGRCTNLWGKPKRRILKQIFHFSQVFRPPKHTYLENSEKIRAPDGIWTHDPPWSSRML